MTKQKFGLTGTALKTIALVLMVMDHIHYFFEFTGVVPEWFSMLARLSAPLFLFCTVEGFAHTHDRRRYFLRIWAIGTAMGTVEFFMIYAGAFRRGDGFYPLNAIFQDLMLLCIIWQGIDWLRQRRFVRGALAAAMPILWPFCIVALLMLFPKIQDAPIGSAVLAWVITAPLPLWTSITDGGWSFLAGGIVLYALYNHKRLRLVVWAAMTFLCDFVLVYLQVHGLPDFAFSQMFTVYYEWLGVFAVIGMALYNGQRGSGHKQLFYWFYPAHIYLLYGASCLVYTLTAVRGAIMANILAVDDDRDLCTLLKTALERDGHTVETRTSGTQLTDTLCRWADCILLDVMMPGEDGFAVCRRIRAETDAPILFLTARTDEPSVLTGLGLGADDYLTKPFRMAELRARVAAHLRRQNRTPSHKITRGGVTLDLSAKEAGVGGTPLHLTKSEYAICELLALHAGQTFSKEQIYEAVFGYDGTADDTAITQHIKNIRAKLRAAGAGEVLQTIWGVGYQWQNEN